MLEEIYFSIMNDGYDCVATRRITRKGEPPIRSLFAKCFYWLIKRICKTEIVDGARDFRLMTRQMVDSILNVPEYNRFSKGVFGWVRFKTKWLEYENIGRVAGQTKWPFWKLFLYSIDGIISFSTAVLSFASVIGFIFFIIPFMMICVIITKTIIWKESVPDWPALACIMFLLGEFNCFALE